MGLTTWAAAPEGKIVKSDVSIAKNYLDEQEMRLLSMNTYEAYKNKEIFAISPSNGVGEFVHPVARNFDDFLRLLLVCDGDAAIEQCWQWSQEQFD